MKKTVNEKGQTQFVNPIGLRIAEPFVSQKENGKWWVRLKYSGSDDASLIGPYSDEQTANNIVEYICS
jgi:hypothetical protein